MKYATRSARSPIAVFDSGLGGLTVVQALRRCLPSEDVIYYGDTARVPYGNKSTETVVRFSSEICQFLLHFEPKCIIAACNTASAVALPKIRELLPVPLLGVVEPSAREAVARSKAELIAVLGTEATIASGAYERAMRTLNPSLRVVQQSCPLLVPIVEEGRPAEDPLTWLAIQDYLTPIQRLRPDVVLLGCTHYPLLCSAMQKFFGAEVTLIDPGAAVADEVRRLLIHENLLNPSRDLGMVECYVSDFPQRFTAIASTFLGDHLAHVTRACAEGWTLPGRTTALASSA